MRFLVSFEAARTSVRVNDLFNAAYIESTTSPIVIWSAPGRDLDLERDWEMPARTWTDQGSPEAMSWTLVTPRTSNAGAARVAESRRGGERASQGLLRWREALSVLPKRVFWMMAEGETPEGAMERAMERRFSDISDGASMGGGIGKGSCGGDKRVGES